MLLSKIFLLLTCLNNCFPKEAITNHIFQAQANIVCVETPTVTYAALIFLPQGILFAESSPQPNNGPKWKAGANPFPEKNLLSLYYTEGPFSYKSLGENKRFGFHSFSIAFAFHCFT